MKISPPFQLAQVSTGVGGEVGRNGQFLSGTETRRRALRTYVAAPSRHLPPLPRFHLPPLPQYDVYGKCWGDEAVVEALFGREKVVFDRKRAKFEKRLEILTAKAAKDEAKRLAAEAAEADARGNETTLASETMLVTAMDDDTGTFVTALPSITSAGDKGKGERAQFDFAAHGY